MRDAGNDGLEDRRPAIHNNNSNTPSSLSLCAPAHSPCHTPHRTRAGKNYLGMNKTFVGNMYIFPDANEPSDATPLQQQQRTPPSPYVPPGAAADTGFSPFCYGSQGSSALPASKRDAWVSETCLVAGTASSVYAIDCSPGSVGDGHAPVLANNSLFTRDGGYSLRCGGQDWDLQTAQSHGLDVGTTIGTTPGTAEVLQMAQEFVQAHLMGA